MEGVLFLHIQKTAGTSILNKAANIYGRETCTMHGDFAFMEPDHVNSMAFVSGHFGFAYAAAFMENRYSFTFLRDPVERLLSLYSYCRGSQREEYEIFALAQDCEPEDFFRLGRSTDAPYASHMWNHQTCQLAHGWGAPKVGGWNIELGDIGEDEWLELAKKNLEKFNYVGLVETIEQDVSRIFTALGDDQPEELDRINVAENRKMIGDLKPTTVDMLREMTRIDQQLYDWVLKRRAMETKKRLRKASPSRSDPV